MVFPVVTYRCESWTIKEAEHWRIDALELQCWRRLLDSKEIKPVNPKGNQSWIFIGRTHAEAPILCLPDAKSWLIEKDPDTEKDWGQEEKEMTKDKIVGWHHRFMDMSLSKPGRWWRTGKPSMLQSTGLQSQTWLSNWTTTIYGSNQKLLKNSWLLRPCPKT